jgi:putative MATE family efflux protein
MPQTNKTSHQTDVKPSGSATKGRYRRSAIDLTQGALGTKLFRLASPLMAGNVLQTVYNLVDMFWVGRLGATAVAAVAIVFPTQWLLISVAMGVTIAGAALVSQWTGAGDAARANFSAAQTLTLSVIVSTVLAVAAFLGRFWLLRLLGASGPLFEPTLDYVSVVFWSVPFTFVFMAYTSTMRGAGETVRPMYVMIGSSLLNMVLDPLMIFGVGPFPAMGVAGAAWATLISRAVAATIGLWLLFNGREAIAIHLRQLIPEWATVRQLLRVGIPGALDGAARSFSAVAMIAIVTRFGPVPTAAYGIGVRVMSLVWTVSGGMGQAVATGVGQNLGAELFARTKRVAWIGTSITFVLLGAAGLVAMLFAPAIIGIFVNDPEVIAMGTHFLRISGWGFGCAGALMVIQGAFQGAGRTGYAMILSLLNRWVLRFPIAIVAGLLMGMGPAGVWWAFLISDVTGFAIGAVWMQFGQWQQRLVSHNRTRPAAIDQPVSVSGSGIRITSRSGTNVVDRRDDEYRPA